MQNQELLERKHCPRSYLYVGGIPDHTV